MAKIKEALADFNPWWKREFAIEFRPREIYEKLQKFIGMPQIIALVGLRRVGKTTLMLKVAEDFIKKGFDAKNIVYFSFDEFKEAGIRDVMKGYEAMMERGFAEGKYILMLDEIQKLENWENQLKTVYDLFKGRIKIIISGSESLFIRKKSREMLAGRIFEFKVEPLSFKEFLIFKGAMFEPISIYKEELKGLFSEFTLTQGFPELVGIKDKEIIKKYIQDGIVGKVIYRDIPSLFKIKDAGLVESLLNIFMEEPGQLVEISELAKELKISRQTLSNYLSYLEKSFLVKKLYNFSKSRRKTERKLRRYYPAIVSVDLSFKEDDIYKSRVFEWQIVNQLRAEFFWRDPCKNEVDVILLNGKIMPIEIKYGKIDTKGLKAFMGRFGVREGYIISLDKEEKIKIEGKTIFVVPCSKFLLGYVP